MASNEFSFAVLVGSGLIGSTLFLASSVAAANPDELSAAERHFEDIRDCRTVSNDAQRLDCYDKAAGSLFDAVDKGEIKLINKDSLQKTKRRLFGFSLPDLGFFGKDDSPELKELETTVTSVARGQGGSWLLSTPESGVWEVRDPPFSFRDPKVGDNVVLKAASLGSYFIRVNGRVGVKANRVR